MKTIKELFADLKALDPATAEAEAQRIRGLLVASIRSANRQLELKKEFRTLSDQYNVLRHAGASVDSPELLMHARAIHERLKNIANELTDPDRRLDFLHQVVTLANDPTYRIRDIIIEIGPTGRFTARDRRDKSVIDTTEQVAVDRTDASVEMQEFASEYAQFEDVEQMVAAKFNVSERTARAAIKLSKLKLNSYHITWTERTGGRLSDKEFLRAAMDRFLIGSQVAQLMLERHKEFRRARGTGRVKRRRRE